MCDSLQVGRLILAAFGVSWSYSPLRPGLHLITPKSKLRRNVFGLKLLQIAQRALNQVSHPEHCQVFLGSKAPLSQSVGERS